MGDSTLAYAPDSPYHGSSGFLNCLSEEQAAALQGLQTHMISHSLNPADLAYNSLHPSLVLLRHLRANGFDVAKAAEAVERSIEWRAATDVRRLCGQQPQHILGCEMKAFTALFPHWHSGYDKQRRPVLYKQYGGFDCPELLQLTSVERIAQYHVWEQEACMRLCMLQSLKSGYLVETITAVIDVGGMHMGQVNSSFMAIVKVISEIDQKQYPETLGRFFIINTPYVFPMVWRMVKAFLDPVVASKIHIISKRSEWQPALLDYIGAENLSSTYGGTAPALTPDLHPYADIMLSWPKEDLLSLSGQAGAGGAHAVPFSLASPLLSSQGDDGEDIMNTFPPSLSSPSASTHDSDNNSESSGSSAFGDTMDGLELRDRDRDRDGGTALGRGGAAVSVGSVLGVLKSHEGWKNELEYLKASRGSSTADMAGAAGEAAAGGGAGRHGPASGRGRVVAFAPAFAKSGQEGQGQGQEGQEGQGLGRRSGGRALAGEDSSSPALRLHLASLSYGDGGLETDESGGDSAAHEAGHERRPAYRACGGALCALAWYLKDLGGRRGPLSLCSPARAPLQARSVEWLLRALKVSLLTFTLLSLCSMAASAYALESLLNVSSLKLEMWTGVAAMLLSSLTFLINLTGLFGGYLRNRRLLLMYVACMTAIVVAFTSLAIASSLFLSSSHIVKSYRDKAIGGFQGNSQAQLLLRRYNIIVCVGSWLVALSALIPMLFASAVSAKLEALEGRVVEDEDDDFFDDSPAELSLSQKHPGTLVRERGRDRDREGESIEMGSAKKGRAAGAGGDADADVLYRTDIERGGAGAEAGEWRQWTNGRATPRKRSVSSVLIQKLQVLSKALLERRQLCVVVHVTLLVCLVFSLAMMGYGAFAINYLLRARFDYPVFAAYSLLYCGVTLLLVVAYGFWAVTVDSPQVIWVQKSIFIPLICVAVSASAALSLGLLPGIRENIRSERDKGNLHEQNERRLEDNSEIQLLVEGLLGFAVVFFQLVCYVSSKQLYSLAVRIDELSKHVHELIFVVEGGQGGGGGAGGQRGKGLLSRAAAAKGATAASIAKLGPHRRSPWATAEWIGEIGRVAAQAYGGAGGDSGSDPAGLVSAFEGAGAEVGGLGSLDQSLFATDAFGGTGTLKSMYGKGGERLGGARKLVVAMAYYRRWVYLRSVPALTAWDKILMAWGILVGIAFIYIKGTFVIFSSWVGDANTPSWILSLWKVMSVTDRRYANSDDFLVSTEGFLALVIGPMALLFAWAIVARSSFRHPIGVFCSSADLYTLLVSIAIEIRTKFRNVSVDNITIFLFLFVLVNFIRALTSLFVLGMESWQISAKAEAVARAEIARSSRLLNGRRRGGGGSLGLGLPPDFS
jgi:hypothetical protein